VIPAATNASANIRQLRGGQITIPAEFRKKLGIEDNTLLRVSVGKGELHIRPVQIDGAADQTWLTELYDLFAPVRDEAVSRDERQIDAAIDEAVTAVRRKYE